MLFYSILILFACLTDSSDSCQGQLAAAIEIAAMPRASYFDSLMLFQFEIFASFFAGWSA